MFGMFNKKERKQGKPLAWNLWEHSGWGNNIDWSDFAIRRLYGLCYGVRKGDYIRCEMESGDIASFKIVNIEYKSDPRDMFFATVKDVGYVNVNGVLAKKEDVKESVVMEDCKDMKVMV